MSIPHRLFLSTPPLEFCNIQQGSLWMIILFSQGFLFSFLRSWPNTVEYYTASETGDKMETTEIKSSHISKHKNSSLFLSIQSHSLRSCWILLMSANCRSEPCIVTAYFSVLSVVTGFFLCVCDYFLAKNFWKAIGKREGLVLLTSFTLSI